MKKPDFGGLAVTMPLKLDIMKFIDEFSDAAKLIGAVNTVVPLKGQPNKFFGDNTDWYGITKSFSRNGVPSIENSSVNGLVIGGGGTARAAAYALHQLGCAKIYMINRTASKLHDIVSLLPQEYNVEVLEMQEQVAAAEPVSVAVSCVAADKPLDENLLDSVESLLQRGAKAKKGGFNPTLLDAVYKPRVTPMMRIAQEKYQWTVVPGVEMLVNQGERQFQVHTGLTPPYKIIHTAVVQE